MSVCIICLNLDPQNRTQRYEARGKEINPDDVCEITGVATWPYDTYRHFVTRSFSRNRKLCYMLLKRPFQENQYLLFFFVALYLLNLPLGTTC